ncbi:MAG TPA: cytochrome c maturation protein CcmE [Spirochaetota bacterium]|nr:cytochrome c maturation protein CcmE [Spirochaetota bacterium]
MNRRKLIILAVIIAFAGLALYSIQGVLTPYVPFQEAMESGEYVQIIGILDKSVPVQHHEGYYTFSLKEKNGTPLNAVHRGLKPFNFEHADQIVALGSFNKAKKVFEAEKILVNCPSKYKKQGNAAAQPK